MVNTLAGSYQSLEMVVMRNLRLPELDKNRNVDQQKALIFESETCKYDVILGADFLNKTGIDVKYSTGTIQWFENELPLRNPQFLKDKDYAAMAEIGAIQQEFTETMSDLYLKLGLAPSVKTGAPPVTTTAPQLATMTL